MATLRTAIHLLLPSDVVSLQAELKFHDLSAMWKDGGVLSADNQCQPRGAVNKPVIPPISFEVSADFFKLNKEDAMDRCKWRKMIKDVR